MIRNYILLQIGIALIVIFPSQLSMHHSSWTPLTGIGLIIFVLIFSTLLIFQKKLKLRIPMILRLLFLGILFSSTISFSFTGNFKSIIVYGALISLFIVVRLFSEAVKNLDKLVNDIIFWACLCGTLILLLGIGKEFSFLNYKGFFLNSNSMGMFCAGLIHMIMGILFGFKNYLSKSRFLFYVSLLSICITFLIASSSRAAILSVILTFIILLYLKYQNTLSILKLKLNIKNLKEIFYIVISIFLIFLLLNSFDIFDQIILKFNRPNMSSGDLTSGRIDSWLFSINNWSWFGYSDFGNFASNYNLNYIGHSTWLMHLNNYGLISFSFFISWILIMLYWSWSKVKNNEKYKLNSNIILFVTLLGYVINASFEEATSTPGIIISIIIFAILFRRPGNNMINN